MAWIYLAESGGSQPPSHNGSNLLPTVNSILTPKESFSPEWLMVNFQTRQSGTMLPLLGETCSHTSILSMAAFLAKTFLLQELEKVWKASEAVYFSRLSAWPKKSSPPSYSLKMSPQSGQGDWIELSRNLPKSGMTVGGQCYPLRTLERTISDNAGSFWRTPDANCGRGASSKDRMAWKLANKMPISLNDQVRWPTPNARDWKGECNQMCLPTLVNDRRNGGTLNPTWVEWLMGYPSEWTVLKDSVMQWFLSKRKRRSRSSYMENQNVQPVE